MANIIYNIKSEMYPYEVYRQFRNCYENQLVVENRTLGIFDMEGVSVILHKDKKVGLMIGESRSNLDKIISKINTSFKLKIEESGDSMEKALRSLVV